MLHLSFESFSFTYQEKKMLHIKMSNGMKEIEEEKKVSEMKEFMS